MPSLGEVKSSDKRFRLGVLASALWVSAMGVLAWFRSGDLAGLSLNEWGDFFAGAFAPLAFLWLVLGYMQQGEELRMSTRALEQQARELKESADQQRQLVEVTRQQVESEREAFRVEQSRREFELSPIIDLIGAGASLGETNSYSIEIANTGHHAKDVKVTVIELDGRQVLIFERQLLESAAKARARYNTGSRVPEVGSKVVVFYCNVSGTQFEKTYSVVRVGGTSTAGLRLESLGTSYMPPNEVKPTQ